MDQNYYEAMRAWDENPRYEDDEERDRQLRLYGCHVGEVIEDERNEEEEDDE